MGWDEIMAVCVLPHIGTQLFLLGIGKKNVFSTFIFTFFYDTNVFFFFLGDAHTLHLNDRFLIQKQFYKTYIEISHEATNNTLYLITKHRTV